jgi:TonB family protein
MRIQTKIDRPCSESWDSMKIGINQRFCENCSKNVIDFTNMRKIEILEYLLLNYDKKVCGRVYNWQIDYKKNDYLESINKLSNQSINSNLKFYLLTLGSLILSGCSTDKNNTNSNGNIVQTEAHKDSIITNSENEEICKINEIKKVNNIELNEEYITLGEIAVIDDSLREESLILADQMPEFDGGFESLTSFIEQNIEYPKWEKDNNIEGTVFLKFVVDKKGKIKNPKIIKSVTKAKNFDNEAIRLVNIMPDWKPGKYNGVIVEVEYNLPIRFKLPQVPNIKF